MLGPPGSGKGTQGSRLATRHGVPHLSTGELLRAHVRHGTALGRAAEAAMSRGDLIADELVIAMVLDEVLGPNAVGGFVLDGFPRTVPQAIAAYDMARRHDVTLDVVILLEIPEDQLITRLTSPLIDYYKGRDILVAIDATGTIDEVAASIDSAVDRTIRPPA